MLFRVLVGFAAVLAVVATPYSCKEPTDPSKGSCSPKGNVVGQASGRLTDRYGRIARGGPTAGWTDVPNSIFHRFHDYLELYVATTIPQYTVQPRTLEWGCADEIIDFFGNIHPIRSCVALVFIYRCKPCDSKGQTEMVGKLLAEGWEPVHCAGYFDLDKNVPSHDHRFTMFYQEFQPTPTSGTTLTLAVEQETEFMFWGQIHKDSTMCAHQLSEPACISHGDDCYWDGQLGACKPVMCPRHPQNPYALGPGYPECQNCVHPAETGLLPAGRGGGVPSPP